MGLTDPALFSVAQVAEFKPEFGEDFTGYHQHFPSTWEEAKTPAWKRLGLNSVVALLNHAASVHASPDRMEVRALGSLISGAEKQLASCGRSEAVLLTTALMTISHLSKNLGTDFEAIV